MHTNRKERLVSRLGRGGQTGRGLPGTALVRADAEVLEMMVVRVAHEWGSLTASGWTRYDGNLYVMRILPQ